LYMQEVSGFVISHGAFPMAQSVKADPHARAH
jgi:hypothetical protein